MRSLLSALFCFSIAALFAAAQSPEALARPGITGYTNKTNTAGCGACHGAQSATVSMSGPASLSVGQPGTYVITLSGASKTGVNVAASDGTLAGATTGMTLSGGELTFTSARNSNTWTFTYTPTTAGSKTLYAAGVINGFQGTWNHAANLSVTVSPATSVAGETPASFSLDQNYPNPFNPSTAIGYTLARPGRVALDVYDLSGNRVATLVDREQDAGSYRVTFDGSGLASGVYLYRLSAGDFTAVRKFVLLK
jgi:hypothetical protein